MPTHRRLPFYRNLDVRRALLLSLPFGLAAMAQDVHAVDHNVSDMTQLRAAITTVNGTTSNDRIILAAGTYTITGATLDNANASGDLDITKASGDLEIIGAGQGSTILDGNSIDRVFHIAAGSSVTVTIQNLSIVNGDATDDGSGSGAAYGGGVLVDSGSLAMDQVTLSANEALGPNGANGSAGGGSGTAGTPAYGGGICFDGTSLQITNSTISANNAVAGDGGNGGAGVNGTTGSQGGVGGGGSNAGGGGIYAFAGQAFIYNTAISSNTAQGGDAGDGGVGGFGSFFGGNGGSGASGGGSDGGGILLSASAILNIDSSQITGNSSLGGNGGNGGAGGQAISNGGVGGMAGPGETATGGGLALNGGAVTLTGVTIQGNTAQGGAGGAGGVGGAGTIVGGAGGQGFNGANAAGGGIYHDAGTVSLVECTVTANVAQGGAGGAGGAAAAGNGGNAGAAGDAFGGGLFGASSGSVMIEASTIDNNSANGGAGGIGADGVVQFGNGGDGGNGGPGGDGRGGGLHLAATTCDIRNSTISGNQVQAGQGGDGGDGADAPGGGGGNGGNGANAGFCRGGGAESLLATLDIYNSTIASNDANSQPGGAAGAAGTGSTTGSPGSAGGSTSSLGGGIYISGGTVTAASTIFADDTSDSELDLSGSLTANNCLVEDNSGATFLSGSSGNLTAQDPQLGALQNNGGPTRTQAISATSPARNAGSNPVPLAFDQRGALRDDGGGVDIGAYEYGVSAPGGGTTGGGGGDGDSKCSTGEGKGLWLLLAGLASALLVTFRRRRA